VLITRADGDALRRSPEPSYCATKVPSGRVRASPREARVSRRSSTRSARAPLWVSGQRSLFHAGKLTEERRRRLDELGFDWR
jgi:hypothetical protein